MLTGIVLPWWGHVFFIDILIHMAYLAYLCRTTQ